ncbi:MAG: hypothetical protein IPN34_14425 [Planctomycetes bacterium]|nr:hypothetical protein [Planctomycetota bacterium]
MLLASLRLWAPALFALAVCGAPLSAQTPTNDECAGATALAIGVNGPFDSTGATTSASSFTCNPSGAEDVWHSYTSICTGQVSFETCGSSIDTVIELYDGSCAALTSLACSDDAGGACGLASRLRVRLTQGVTYYLRVGIATGLPGSYGVIVSHSGSVGSFSTLATGCDGVSMTASGAPTVAGTIRYDLSGSTGVPFLWFGLPVGPVVICPGTTCALGAEIGVAGSSTNFQVTLPCDPTILGGVIAVQGADLQMTTGSCPAGESFHFRFSDTIVTQIG